MNKYVGDFLVGKTVRLPFNTVSNSGVPTTLTVGAVIVSKDGADVTPSGGVTLTTDQGSVTGRHVVTIDLSVDTSTFTAGSDYTVRLAGSSAVAGVSVVGAIVGQFSIQNRSVAPQTGDAYARIGAGGAGLTSLGDVRLNDLDAPVSTRSTYAGGPVAAVTDRTGYALAANGLDSIPTTDPGGVATTFPQMVVQLWRLWFRKSVKDVPSLTIKTYADDGGTVRTTQSYTDDGAGNQSRGAAT